MQTFITKCNKRINIVLLLMIGLLCAPVALAQKPADNKQHLITYQCKNEKLSVALKQVERLSNYYKVQFAFDDVDPYTVTAKLEQATITKAIQELLKTTKLTFDGNGRFIQIYNPGTDEDTRKLTGMVKDLDGEPLVGVAVVKEGTNQGAITDIYGRFSLPGNKKKENLVITYIGKKKQIFKATLGGDNVVIMEDEALVMEDIVITGYQQINKRYLTSAVSSVNMNDIQIPGKTDLTQMLDGRIPDLVMTNSSGELNSTPKIRIRGTSTIIGNREPLWVVDGIIVSDPVNLSPDVLNDPDYVNRIGNAISGLNPQDIERLDVLKDAAATALYGTRAANGVIVVTTKKGRVGKPLISYSGTATFRRRPHYTDDKINLMNSQERIRFSQDLVANHYVYNESMPLVGYEHALSNYYNGTLSKEQFQSEVARMQTMNTDWFDLLTHNSFSHDHSLSISGGSQLLRYYASVGYTDEEDVINNTGNRRLTVSTKIDASLSRKFLVSFNISGYVSDRKYDQPLLNPIDYAYNTSRAIPAYNADGTYAFYKVMGYEDYQNFHIMNELENSYQQQKNNGITATVNLRYNVFDWMNISAVASGTANTTNIEGYWGEKTNHVAFYRRSEYGEPAPSESLFPFGGELSTNNSSNKNYTARLQLNINKYLDKDNKHLLNVVVGTEANSNNYNGYLFTQRGYYPDRGKIFINDIDPQKYPNYYNRWVMGNTPSISDSKMNLFSVYATASYNFKDLFTVNANTRYDGSNKFGSRSNEKFLPIWSISGMADLKAISKIKADWLDNLTFKLSYGEQGNMLDNQTPKLTLKKGSYNSYYDEYYSKVSSFANPDLRWEKTHSTNVGLETSLFKGRLMVGAEYFYKKTTDAFMNKPISDVNGFNSYIVNSGTIINQGYNINVTATPVRTRTFNWLLSASISQIENEMKTLPGQDVYELEDFLNGTAIVQGQPVGTFYSYKYAGLSPVDGGPLFDDFEDRRSELVGLSKYETYTKVLAASGRRDPNITGSINNTFTYKNWRLGITMNYSMGAKTRLFRMMEDFSNGYSAEMNVNRDLLNAWKHPGDELHTHIPAIMGPSSPGFYYYNSHWSDTPDYKQPVIAHSAWSMYDYSDLRVVSANYLKISNVSLTYEVPKKILNNWKLNRLAFTFGATNLHTFCSSKLRGQTPTQGGFSEVRLSDTPTYTMGLNLNF